MVETTGLWSVIMLPVVLAAATLVVVTADAAASGGSPAAPLREVVRLLVAQPRTTVVPDAVLRRIGVVTLSVAAVLAAVVVPLGSWSVADLDVGIVWFNAMEVLAWAAVWLAGWGQNAVFGLVGGYRFIAQGLAYELPHMFAIITAALGAESLRVGGVVSAQVGLWFVVWMPVAFVAYLLSVVAMAFWGPFDAPVARDVAGGAAAELSGVDRLLFLGGRWLLLVVAAAFAVPLFLGGGRGPLLPPWLWMLVKTAAVLAVLLWARRRLPTVRMDRYVELAWVVLIPATILQAIVVAVVVLVR